MAERRQFRVGLRRRVAVLQDVREQQGLRLEQITRDGRSDPGADAHGGVADRADADRGGQGAGLRADGHERFGPVGLLAGPGDDQRREDARDHGHGILAAASEEPPEPAGEDQLSRDPATGERGHADGVRRGVRGPDEQHEEAAGAEGGDPERGRDRVAAHTHGVGHRAGRGPRAAGHTGGAGPARWSQPAAPRGQPAGLPAERDERPAAVVRRAGPVPEAQGRAAVHDRRAAGVRVPAVGPRGPGRPGRRAAVLRRVRAQLRVRAARVRLRRARRPGQDERAAGEPDAAEPGHDTAGQRGPVRPAPDRPQLPGRGRGRRAAGVGPEAGQPADTHARAAEAGRHDGHRAGRALPAARVRLGPVLAVPGPVPHAGREPSRGHVQDGPGVRSRGRGRPAAQGAQRQRRPRGRRVRPAAAAQQQSDRSHRHGSRKGGAIHQRHVESLIPFKQYFSLFLSLCLSPTTNCARRIITIQYSRSNFTNTKY